MRSVWVLALVALLAGLGDAALNDVITVTMRALHGNENHDRLLVKKAPGSHA